MMLAGQRPTLMLTIAVATIVCLPPPCPAQQGIDHMVGPVVVWPQPNNAKRVPVTGNGVATAPNTHARSHAAGVTSTAHATEAPRMPGSGAAAIPVSTSPSMVTVQTTTTKPNQPLVRLASTRRLPPLRRSFGNQERRVERSPFESPSPYRLPLIHQARQDAITFRDVAATAPNIVAQLAATNSGFADQWADLAERMIALSDRVDDATKTLDQTHRDFEDVDTKLNRYGMTPTIGMLLRDKQRQLDARQVHDSHPAFANQELQWLRDEQLKLEMVRFDGADPLTQTTDLLITNGYDTDDIRNQALAAQISQLLRQRQIWIESLETGYEDYRQKLSELDSVTTAADQLAGDFRKLIDRHIIWIRSDDPISGQDLRNLKGGLAALFDTGRSADFGPALARKWTANPASALGLLAGILLILFVRWRAKSWLIGIGNQKRMRQSPASSRKLVASLLTPIVALSFPGILYAIGRWLNGGVVSESTVYVAGGCYAASLVAMMVEVPRQLLRNGGLLDQHIDVDLPRRGRAMAYLTLIGCGLVLAAYMITVMGSIDHGIWNSSLARLGFMAAMLLVAWTCHLALRPTGGFLEPLIARFGGTVIHRVRLLIYLAGIGFPLAMAGLSALGFGYTATALVSRAIITLCGLLIAATLWTGIKIASARAWHVLTASSSPISQDQSSRSNTEHVVGTLGEQSLELKHQIAFLCQCALVLGAIVSIGWLWIDAVPNARMGNPIVWTVNETVIVPAINANGQTVEETAVEITSITAMHLLLAAATLFVAFQLSKLLPALFDVLVLQRVSFDEAMEHFTLVLGRCLLFGVGCFVACRLIGVRWQTIQWLAVGLTIGLGFGLQDMVRNVFGGLVVLFEKPARLGDFITVGKVTGRVAAQRLRTTVLSDDDGREVTIPNKKFVSEDVVNWMGAGRLQVIPIEVAVTRDERPADICRLLYELALDQADVLLTPAPQATLVCVGQRSQRIEVRVWIENDHNPKRYRDQLLRTAKTFLREHEWLAADQPPQPEIPDMDHQPMRSTRSNRRRSA